MLVTRGAKFEVIDEKGGVVRTYPLEGRGWATIKESLDTRVYFCVVLLQWDAVEDRQRDRRDR